MKALNLPALTASTSLVPYHQANPTGVVSRNRNVPPLPASRRLALGGSEGRRWRRADAMVYKPRRDIAWGPATVFKNGGLKIARDPPPADAPVGELRAFKVRFTAGGRDTHAASNRVRSVAIERAEKANRYQGRAPI